MMTFLLLELTDTEAIYEYHPGGKEDCGIVSIDRKSGEWRFVEKEKSQRGIGMITALARRLIREGKFPEKTMVACW